MKCWKKIILTVVVFCAVGGMPMQSAAQTTIRADADQISELDQTQPQPVVSADATWAGVMLIIIAGLFLAAACIGPIARMNRSDESSTDC